MTLDDIFNDDVIGAGVWSFFSVYSGLKLLATATTDPTLLSVLSPLVGTICGAVIGWRHVQNLRAITEAKLEIHREIELARINAGQGKPSIDQKTIDIL
jgi:hypothetical protein